MALYINLYKQSQEEGTSQAFTANTITLEATASAVDDYYLGWTVLISSGNLKTQTRTITGYNGTTKVATVANWDGFTATYEGQYRLSGTIGSGDKTGVLVSDGDESSPLKIFHLNATIEEVSNGYPVALRCDDGYRTVDDTVIAFDGATNALWSASFDNITWSAWGSGLTFTTSINNLNKLFYVRAKALSTEVPSNDISVNITLATEIAAT